MRALRKYPRTVRLEPRLERSDDVGRRRCIVELRAHEHEAAVEAADERPALGLEARDGLRHDGLGLGELGGGDLGRRRVGAHAPRVEAPVAVERALGPVAVLVLDARLRHDLDGHGPRAADGRVRRPGDEDEALVLVVAAQVVDAHLERRRVAGVHLEHRLALLGELEERHLAVHVLALVEEADLDLAGAAERVHEGLRRRLVEQPEREAQVLFGRVRHGEVHPVAVAAHVLVPREAPLLHAALEAVLPALVLGRGDGRDAHGRRPGRALLHAVGRRRRRRLASARRNYFWCAVCAFERVRGSDEPGRRRPGRGLVDGGLELLEDEVAGDAHGREVLVEDRDGADDAVVRQRRRRRAAEQLLPLAVDARERRRGMRREALAHLLEAQRVFRLRRREGEHRRC